MFETGQSVTLQDVLNARESRVQLQNELLKQYEGNTLINYKCNIPGPIKNNAAIKALFQQGFNDIIRSIVDHNVQVIDQKVINWKTGIEAFIMVAQPPKEVKKWMVAIEENSPLGRLFDIDVIYRDQDSKQEQVQSISRTDLGFPERMCLICDQPAKACGRNRTHSVEEMQAFISQLAKDNHLV
ncbi:citrate lyase holo-[acyl-carrier protein] synthase [Streptococcus moroccensis]|uniref:citrate lyase holo-[acyl-carrier protein] synthase n=1 Tax=Streptococcus moroccensis TaxID=1451356 RepID=A0ABT9YR11_9STRE|nr:citrate lyase holo-[acyl-carrier protein] synthase [Streptococcus moroccensis]MDQ0222169.1 holo-ACP synthase CitX [Streptococcus moroccensis]